MKRAKHHEDPALSVPIITYHSIDESGFVISTTPAVFRRQMNHLKRAGYAAVTVGQLLSTLGPGAALPEKTVVLTFDDGFRNFYTDAFPVLSECGFSATVFLVTDHCGKRSDWPGNPPSLRNYELLSWSEIRELDRHGIEFGSHTRTHPDLTKLDSRIAERELVESKSAIEDALGREVGTFAYPFGKLNSAVKCITAAHFRAACSTDLGKVTARSEFAALPRIDSYYLSNQLIFEQLKSSRFDSYMRLRQTLRRVRSLLPAPIKRMVLSSAKNGI